MWGFFIKEGHLRRLPEHQWKKQRRKKLPPNMKEIHGTFDLPEGGCRGDHPG